MDTLRGNFDANDFADDRDDYQRDWDVAEEDIIQEAPPIAIGTDERRMQVRAYNHWASLLNDRSFPSIEDLVPASLPDFAPYSVLLDFTLGMDNPGIQYLGDKLAGECGAETYVDTLSDVPSRSLLSRITDHYMQILANQAPIGFEAEFVNQRGATILYRGILLPFSSSGDEIDFIFGVINWKEMADQETADELLLEIDQALEMQADTSVEPAPESADTLPEGTAPVLATKAKLRSPDPVTDWADGPGAETPRKAVVDLSMVPGETPFADSFAEDGFGADDDFGDEFPLPSFGGGEDDMPLLRKKPASLQGSPGGAGEKKFAGLLPDVRGNPEFGHEADAASEIPPANGEEGLHDCLAAARELAHAALSCEDRSRSALYAAVGRAYDFSLAARDCPEEFEEIVSDNQLTVQKRAPMTPVVKLVFGADYDKTRLTEYAAVLGHAHRMNVTRGTLAGFLAQAEGGLKGVVQTERKLRREESGKQAELADSPRERLAGKLRELELQSFAEIMPEGEEFGLVMIRRLPTGEVAMMGEITGDTALIERAARKLIAPR